MTRTRPRQGPGRLLYRRGTKRKPNAPVPERGPRVHVRQDGLGPPVVPWHASSKAQPPKCAPCGRERTLKHMRLDAHTSHVADFTKTLNFLFSHKVTSSPHTVPAWLRWASVGGRCPSERLSPPSEFGLALPSLPQSPAVLSRTAESLSLLRRHLLGSEGVWLLGQLSPAPPPCPP